MATGAVSTLVGTAGVDGSANGVGRDAQFSYPLGIASDGTSLYVTGSFNNTVRKIQ